VGLKRRTSESNIGLRQAQPIGFANTGIFLLLDTDRKSARTAEIAIRLRYFDGLSSAEIARRQGYLRGPFRSTSEASSSGEVVAAESGWARAPSGAGVADAAGAGVAASSGVSASRQSAIGLDEDTSARSTPLLPDS
jgi:hypothetical protein